MFGLTRKFCKFGAMEHYEAQDELYFTVRPGQYVSKAMPRWLLRRGWWLWLPAAVLTAAGAYDMRWLLAALMLVAVLAPAAMAMVYFHSALSPRAAMQTLPHAVAVVGDTLRVSFAPKSEDQPAPEPWSIPATAVTSIEPDGAYWLVWMTEEPLVPVVIPAEYIKNAIGTESWHTFCSLVCYEK